MVLRLYGVTSPLEIAVSIKKTPVSFSIQLEKEPSPFKGQTSYVQPWAAVCFHPQCILFICLPSRSPFLERPGTFRPRKANFLINWYLKTDQCTRLKLLV